MKFLLIISKRIVIYIVPSQGRSQDFVFGGAKRKFGGASLKIFKILNIGHRNFYVMFKWQKW